MPTRQYCSLGSLVQLSAQLSQTGFVRAGTCSTPHKHLRQSASSGVRSGGNLSQEIQTINRFSNTLQCLLTDEIDKERCRVYLVKRISRTDPFFTVHIENRKRCGRFVSHWLPFEVHAVRSCNFSLHLFAISPCVYRKKTWPETSTTRKEQVLRACKKDAAK